MTLTPRDGTSQTTQLSMLTRPLSAHPRPTSKTASLSSRWSPITYRKSTGDSIMPPLRLFQCKLSPLKRWRFSTSSTGNTSCPSIPSLSSSTAPRSILTTSMRDLRTMRITSPNLRARNTTTLSTSSMLSQSLTHSSMIIMMSTRRLTMSIVMLRRCIMRLLLTNPRPRLLPPLQRRKSLL